MIFLKSIFNENELKFDNVFADISKHRKWRLHHFSSQGHKSNRPHLLNDIELMLLFA
jgi:hypothetical protein